MLQFEEAKGLLKKQVQLIQEIESVPLADAVGRILAEDGCALVDQPPFPRSPLDGYAVRAEDTLGASKDSPKSLRVIGKIYAGMVLDGQIHHGEAVRIMTGAPIPSGADTVIRQENTDYGKEQVQVYEELCAFDNYCPQGEDYKTGDILLKKRTILDGVSIALLASLGKEQIKVYRKPRIAIISTGDEVVLPGQKLLPGKIYDSNLYYLYGRLLELGIKPVFACHCGDNPQKMANIIREQATKADLIISTGGVSVGEKDIMHEVIQTLNAKKLFWRVDMKPGAPTLAAKYQGVPVICLSGNPFGAAANFELLVRPMIAELTGHCKWNMEKKQAVMETDYSKGGVRRFIRGYYEDGKVMIPKGNLASGVLSSMLGCNCLIEITPEQCGVKKGDLVWVYLL